MPHFGWLPDPPDLRDELYGTAEPLSRLAQKLARWSLPTAFTLRDKFSTIFDQGDLGSCVGNAISAMVRYERLRHLGYIDFIPSRLFLYYFARRLRGWEAIDGGCIIRDAMKVLVADGVCTEPEWPYDITKFAVRPPQQTLHTALAHTATKYLRLPRDLYRIKRCLFEGHPFVLGFSVYESFDSHQVTTTGVVPMPRSSEEYLGGHCVLAVGYDDTTRRVEFLNSWSSSWGNFGFGYMPYDYFMNENLSDDWWTVRQIR